jgi:hypothetical protein
MSSFLLKFAGLLPRVACMGSKLCTRRYEKTADTCPHCCCCCRFSAVSGRQLLKEGDMNAAADKIARTQYDLNAENVAR